MSYQNPLTLTPKMYQSSDPQAPQLTGAMGDYKSVFKACLVTGYGNKQGAGYAIENETDRSCEFVSPNIMMSKIGVEEDNSHFTPYHYDDTTKVVSTWIIGRLQKSLIKNPSWTMLVCELGVCFIITTNGMSQINYVGLVKSAINDGNKNIVRLNLGHLSSSSTSVPIDYQFRLGKYTSVTLLSNGASLSNGSNGKTDDFFVSLVSDIFWRSNGVVLAGMPNILTKNAMTNALEQKVSVSTYQGRPVLSIFVGNGQNESNIKNHAFGAMIYLDYWEY